MERDQWHEMDYSAAFTAGYWKPSRPLGIFIGYELMNGLQGTYLQINGFTINLFLSLKTCNNKSLQKCNLEKNL